jgi:DNA replication initiation complex subunit (GINS family)
MYNELYSAWRREIEESLLGQLPSDFYARTADYLRHIGEESNMIDKKSLKVNLLEHEAQNVKRMLEELIWARYKKLVRTITQSQTLPSDLLTVEEVKMGESFATFTGAYQKFAKDLMQGQTAKVADKIDAQVDAEVVHKRVTLRFMKSIPAIIGSDMKSYGPFAAEDVGSLPVENAKMLVKQGLAVSIEVY